MGKKPKSPKSKVNKCPPIVTEGSSKDKSLSQTSMSAPTRAHKQSGSPSKQRTTRSSTQSAGNAAVVAVKQAKPTQSAKDSQHSEPSRTQPLNVISASPAPSKGPRANTPRLDKRSRVLARFYEPMVLLFVLGKTRGEHQRVELPNRSRLEDWPIKHIRRLFLLRLAYLCDYETGGDRVTAIALEHKPERRTFWVAANTNPEGKIVPFLKSILCLLRGIAVGDRSKAEGLRECCLHMCFHFAENRLKTYARWLDQAISKAKTHLNQLALQDAKCTALLPWLEQFRNSRANYIDLCSLAYETRKGPLMSILASLCKEPSYNTTCDDAAHQKFRKIRHYVGRLAHHVSAVNTLVACAPKMIAIFDEYDVRAITPPPRSPRPLTDGMTNLMSILGRMSSSFRKSAEHYQFALQEMDQRYLLSTSFLEVYANPNFRPRVHAEVQMLDHFHSHTLNFDDGDRFIASSKPACYLCCKHFKFHPLDPVPPATHQTIYPNWAPPTSLMEDEDQKTILQKMTEEIRKEALQQIDKRRPGCVGHPDSTTGITVSALGHDENDDSDLEVAFDDGDDVGDLDSDGDESVLDSGDSGSSSGSMYTLEMRLSERDIFELDQGVPLTY